MKINIFEGARRITKLIAVIWVLGMSFYAFTEKGYIPAYFRVDLSDGVPIRMTEQERCDKNDATEYLSSQYTSKGSDVSVTLCFKPYVDKESDWVDVPAGQQVKTQPQQPKIVDELPAGFKFVDEEPAKQQQAPKPKPYDPNEWEDITPTKPAQQPQQPQQRKPTFEEFLKNEYKPEQAKQKKIAANFKLSKVDEEWADGVAWSKRLENIKTSATVTIGGLAFLWIFSWCVGWIVRGFAGIPSGQDFKS
jgi:hypothetical protein